MIMKTIRKGTDKIDHVEYGDNVIYFYSSKSRNGRTRTEMISKRIIGRIMKNHTEEEYNTLLETVVKSARGVVSRASLIHKKNDTSCSTCPDNGACEEESSCTARI